jgi:hypothetical protein
VSIDISTKDIRQESRKKEEFVMELTPKGEAPGIKVLVEISAAHHHSLLKRASEASPVYFRLKNAVKTESGTILVPCNEGEAEMLLQVAKHFCPEAVLPIETAIKACPANSRSA